VKILIPYSKTAIKKLGKRLRGGDFSIEDIHLLEEFRSSFKTLLIDTVHHCTTVLSNTNVRFIISGRSKRTKSIIRKLQRPSDYGGMDLFRMGDLIGVRIIVISQDDQQTVYEKLKQSYTVDRDIDYRDRDLGYRAIHLVVRNADKRVEIQIRTIPQHFWAEESESFGERVKEGGGNPTIREYLEDLTPICKEIDCHNDLNVNLNMRGKVHVNFFKKRIPVLIKLFMDATTHNSKISEINTFVLVYDNRINELVRISTFNVNEQTEATAEFNRLTNYLTDSRFEILILNSKSEEALAVTHSRFFPCIFLKY